MYVNLFGFNEGQDHSSRFHNTDNGGVSDRLNVLADASHPHPNFSLNIVDLSFRSQFNNKLFQKVSRRLLSTKKHGERNFTSLLSAILIVSYFSGIKLR